MLCTAKFTQENCFNCPIQGHLEVYGTKKTNLSSSIFSIDPLIIFPRSNENNRRDLSYKQEVVTDTSFDHDEL